MQAFIESPIGAALLGAIGGIFLSLFMVILYALVSGKRLTSSKAQAREILEKARKEAGTLVKEGQLEIKDERHKMMADFEKEAWKRKQELMTMEKRLLQREENFDKKVDLLEKKGRDIDSKDKEFSIKSKELDKRKSELTQLIEEEKRRLQDMSGLSIEEAKRLLFVQIEEQVRQDVAQKIKRMEEEIKLTMDKKAQEILSLAIQRCAFDHVVESTVSVVTLPNEEMKGRIIGREGRNIRALESATGIDIIVDDTPEAVILSGYNPIRRAIARISLERLMTDGRIHPARIEEVVEKVKEEVEASIKQEGETAAMDAGVHDLHTELIRLLGKLKYRTSYGQNVLQHSKEVAFIAGIIADELKLNPRVARRAALLHDIGKAVDYEVEGTHPQIGAELSRKYGETEAIINAILAHHGDQEPTSTVAVIVQAADTVSAARPGARRETLENYIKRLEKLEKIADSFQGVEKTFAIQAGREIRVMVEPSKISDAEAILLARDITKRVEKELEYPGQIKVTVIRETRAVEFAK